MATATVNYSANTAIDCDLSSLAASTTFVAGRQSAVVDNTTNKFMDALVNIDGITGSASSATVGQLIAVYVYGSDTSTTSLNIDDLDGTDSAATLTSAMVLNSLRFCGAAAATVTTASQVYYIQPFSVAALLGGVMPKFWGLFLAHNHTGALAATQSGLFSYNGIKYDIA
jgi:hypothetical protein